MNLTPEQKAFYEYGKAREALRLFKTDFAYREETLREFYENYVCEAWQKRAACRAWVPLEKRECRTCSYLEEDDGSEICENCMIFNSLASSCNWEPRKEGE